MTTHRLKRNLHLRWQLVVALIVVVLFSPRDAPSRIVAALKAWVKWTRKPTPTPFHIFVARLRTCRRCAVYSAKAQTCGSPIFAMKEARSIGCFCSCVFKAAIAESDCWLRMKGIHDACGWPDNLRRLAGVKPPTAKPCANCQERRH